MSLAASVLRELEESLGLDWFDELTRTEFPPPRPPGTFMAYWTTRGGKHLSDWNQSDAIVTLFNKRIIYLHLITKCSLRDAVTRANEEFNKCDLGQEERACVSCGMTFNPAHNLGEEVDRFGQVDRETISFRLQRKRCSEMCSELARWQDSVRRGMLPGAEFDESITWEGVWERFGPYCYICGIEAIHDQEDLGLRAGTKAWKARWGDYQRGDREREAVVEHVRPRSKGGSHTWDNVRISCTRCNLLKGDSDPLDGSQPENRFVD